MTTSNTGNLSTTEAVSPPQEGTAAEEGQPQAPAELRAHADRQEAAAKAEAERASSLRSQLLEERLESMGLSKDVGVGKAIYQSYEGDDLSKEAVANYAHDEWGHEAQATPQAQIAEGEQRLQSLSGVTQVTTPSQEPDEFDQIQQKMMDPESITRDLVVDSIGSKIGRWFFPKQ